MTGVAIKNLPGLQITTLENKNSQMQRLGVLNDSYRKRYATYTKIAAMVVIFLVGFILIQMVEPMLPGVVANLLMIVLVLFVGYYVAIYFSELGSRSTLNYDELDLPTKNPGEKDKIGNLTPGSASDLMSGVPNGTCADDSCCATGTTFNTKLGKCIPENCDETTNKYYSTSENKCVSSSSGNTNLFASAFTTLGDMTTSGEKYVDKSRLSLPISAVNPISDSGLIPSNVGISQYTSVSGTYGS